jgi:hypothetical protein
MVLMIMSGWQIYNASPLFDFLHFRAASRWALKRRCAALALRRDVAADGQRPDHIALGLPPAFRRRAVTPGGSRHQGGADSCRMTISKQLRAEGALRRRDRRRHRHRVVRLSIWKPGSCTSDGAVRRLRRARYVHFICMALIVAFMVVHVALALLVPKSLRAMIIGR